MSRGFTLLEVLVAMTLMSVILLLLYSGMRFGARSWEVSTARAEISSELRLVQDFIRRQWRQSNTVFYNDDDEGLIVAFHGESNELQLVAPMLAHLGFGGLYWVHYDLADDGGTRVLRLRWWPYQPDGNTREEDPAGENILLRGVNELHFSYFGAEEPQDDPEWHDTWDSVRLRPQLIRLTLDWVNADWPPLVVALAGV